ncbi:MAG TPA: hypothetical protein VGG29_03530 [Caulobacteraceae bacterium]|jgi:hypothetical protein
MFHAQRPTPRVLFVLLWRKAPAYGMGTWGASQLAGDDPITTEPLSHGLSNSAGFVVAMLNEAGIDARLVHVKSDNDIWKEIEAYRPTHVVLEAFWCRPKKLDDLRPLFPDVQFIVRGHSSTPFLAHDTYGFKWALEYLGKPGAVVAPNDQRHVAELRLLARKLFGAAADARVPWLPNYYPERHALPPPAEDDGLHVDVGCFGAARPFKNMVGQALAAMLFAERVGRRLRFHINGDRIECGGGPTVKNLEWIFEANPYAELVRHDWMPHAEFLDLVASMDLVAQVSFAETFCIVAADAVSQGVPLVTSAEVAWSTPASRADPTDPASMADAMHRAWLGRHANRRFDPSLHGLKRFCAIARETWLEFLQRPAA